MIRKFQGHIIQSTSCYLTTKLKLSVDSYNDTLRQSIGLHKIPEHLHTIINLAQHNPDMPSLQLTIHAHNLHTQLCQLFLHAEWKCQKILKPASPFSLPIKNWYNCIHTFKQLIWLCEGNHPWMGRSQVYHFAKCVSILTPSLLTILDCKEGIWLSKICQQEVRKHETAHCSQHLGTCHQVMMDKEDDTKVAEIKALSKQNATARSGVPACKWK